MKRFSFKSGHAMHVAKFTETDWLVVLQKEFWLNTALYYFLKVLLLEYLSIELNQRIKSICVAMCSLVMSLCSCDIIAVD